MSDYKGLKKGDKKLVDKLVEENLGWATAIAKSVARAWNLDWQIDGLDGGAYEGLLFCAGRFDPELGIPFRGYARRRIHEAATEEARKSKTWKQNVGSEADPEQESRDLSARVLEIFPEIREGFLPSSDGDGEEAMRASIKQLIAGASLLYAFRESNKENPELAVEYRRLLDTISELEPVHQSIVWSVYWEGNSMRALAREWDMDELSIIREHKEILRFLSGKVSGQTAKTNIKLKVRRGLKAKALELRKEKFESPFGRLDAVNAGLVLLMLIVQLTSEIGL